MLYNQPFGVSDPNAPYINGNPGTGTMGSIPPAASIEYPQREIVALITEAGLTPSNADLAQLTKTVKLVDVLNKFKMGVNSGTANQWSMTCPALPVMPPPTGTAVWFKPGFASLNGGTVFSLNGAAFVAVVCADLTPIAIGDVNPNAWLLLFFDGTHWQALVGLTRQFGALPLLTANANWYVNGTTGDDTNYDGTSATVVAGTARGPFKTLQRAASECPKYNMNGYSQNVYVADGSYAGAILPQTNGAGVVNFIGNAANPQNCSVTSTTPNTHAFYQTASVYSFNGFRLSATGTGTCDGLGINYNSKTTATNLRFGACTRGNMTAGWNSTITLSGGTFTIEAGATSANHLLTSFTSNIANDPYNVPALNILGAVNIAQFCWAAQLGVIQVMYSSITGKANVTGAQYAVTGNSIVTALGGGATYFPGTVAGSTSYGGQYIP